jgi:hypothetical protein
MLLEKWRAKGFANFSESPVPIVMVNKVALKKGRYLRVNVTIGNEKINPSVVVVIEEFRSPTNIRQTHRGDFCLVR